MVPSKMRRYWEIVDVDEKTYEEIEFMLEGTLWSQQIKPESLMVPIWPKEHLWTMTEDLVEQRAKDSTAPILKLPTELLTKVVGHLNTSADVAAFCIAHPILGVIGEDRFRQVYERDNGSRAGHRLITLGEWAQVDDLPCSVEDDLRHDLNAYKERRAADPKLDRPEFYETLLSVCVTEAPYREYENEGHCAVRWEWADKLTTGTRDWDELESLQDFISSSYPRASLYEEDSDLVLCNLSEGVYVRNDTIRWLYTRLSQIEPMIVDDLDLGTVVLAYNCWSTESASFLIPVSTQWREISRGPWAGNRFEIRPFATMCADVEWTDVTDEAVAWLEELFELEDVVAYY